MSSNACDRPGAKLAAHLCTEQSSSKSPVTFLPTTYQAVSSSLYHQYFVSIVPSTSPPFPPPLSCAKQSQFHVNDSSLIVKTQRLIANEHLFNSITCKAQARMPHQHQGAARDTGRAPVAEPPWPAAQLATPVEP